MTSGPGPNEHDALRDEPIDVSRYAAVIRRNALLVAAIVALCTAGTWAASSVLPPTYDARAELIVLGGQGGDPGGGDSQALSRELATLQSLAETSSVLQPAAEELGVDVDDLRSRVASSVEGQTSILVITARGGTPEAAQESANTVVQSLIERRRDAERARLDVAIRNITEVIAALGNGGTVDQQQRDALVQRRAELTVAAATAGNNLELAQEAERPPEPSSPRPVRNAVIAFFGSLLLALLVALTRDRLRVGQAVQPGRKGARNVRRRRGAGAQAGASQQANDGPILDDGRRPDEDPEAGGTRAPRTSLHQP